MPKQLVTQFEFDSPNLLDGYESNGSPLKRFFIPNECFNFYKEWAEYLFNIISPSIQSYCGMQIFIPYELNIENVYYDFMNKEDSGITLGSASVIGIIKLYLQDIISINTSVDRPDEPDKNVNMYHVRVNHYHLLSHLIFLISHEISHQLIDQYWFNPMADENLIESRVSSFALFYLQQMIPSFNTIIANSYSISHYAYRSGVNNKFTLENMKNFGSTIGRDIDQLMRSISNMNTNNHLHQLDPQLITAEGYINLVFETIFQNSGDVTRSIHSYPNVIIDGYNIYRDRLAYSKFKTCAYYDDVLVLKEDGIYQNNSIFNLQIMVTNWINYAKFDNALQLVCEYIQLKNKTWLYIHCEVRWNEINPIYFVEE